MPEPPLRHEEVPLSEAETNWVGTKLMLVEHLKLWSQEEGSSSLHFEVA